MLRSIRKITSTVLGLVVMTVVVFLLIASFAVWGINDIFRGFGRSTVATIGGTEIPIQQFQQTYQERLHGLQQNGRPIPAAVAQAYGLPRQVLSEMVAQAALDQRARQMRLGISDAEVARHITSNPMFQNGLGQFDRDRFEGALRNVGYNEQRFVAEQRNVTLRRQIIDSVSGGIALPQAWLDAFNQMANQERSIAYLMLGPAQAGDIAAPTDDELRKYFEARKIQFRAPEYRKIATVVGTPQELAKTVEVSDDDVKKFFDEYHSRYITPERRRVERMVFPTMAEAQAASDRLKGGLSLAALAEERGVKEPDLDLGTVPKSLIIDPAVADAAFSLKDGEISAPVQARDGAVIVTVTKIVPEDAKSFADVAPQIRNEIATARAKQAVTDVHNKVEDARAGGATLEEAAQKFNLPIVTYDAIDQSGHDPAGKLVEALPHAGDVVNAAFATDVGVDNDPIDADGGYIWYDVTAITPARDRNLDEVKSQVEAQWRDAEIASRLKAKVTDIVDKLKNGATLETMASDSGVKVETATGIKRNKPTATIPAPAIGAIFHTAQDAYGSSAGDTLTQWIVFRVTDIKTPALDANAADMKQFDQQQQRQVSDDVFGQYMAWLENNLGTSVNQAALAQALGSGSSDTN